MPRKKRWAVCHPALIFFILVSFSTLVSFANPIEVQQESSPPTTGSRIGLAILCGGGSLNSYFANGLACGAAFSLGLSKNIAIELAGLFIYGSGESDPETLYEGKLAIMPMQLSLLGRFPISRKLTPYILAGGSYFLNRFALDRSVANGWDDLGITLTQQIDNVFGFHLGAGLEFAMASAWSLVVDARYCVGNTQGDWIIRDNISGVETDGTFSNLDLNTLFFSIGLKYFFK
ncbi:MAG: outer membrane beta-barrel protein [Candidatus Aminicenantes bacterium]|nr:outer membrane beta-barrel protein [Candidatus Aminicenantes bacterium]